ncbi:hypothetical protein CCC_01594 [Paramagnetospirillum magnetotacticum MS-1]|uniref:DUF2779 domain-containing protein n=1 Tax=Paramagnetospirillum magnetotacticum MS-1 TaxID=272627 RepID=A0A0C2YNP0_PARME|nr:DUF2779 domain-containing protein [Paramagnetospirillum magnetotacticum]KIL96728.1 hypothetical protein CCC_01594 [Paramagnetospirillum magnetotacticum MS-1]
MVMLSKSKLLAYRQCHRRLWLELHHPELCENSESTQARFSAGHRVGDIARKIYDPMDNGVFIDARVDGYEAAFARTQALLVTPQPIFEAGFRAEGALAFADVMLPIPNGETLNWRMVEVKSSSKVKDYHRDDAAVQAFIARSACVPLTAIAVAHIDTEWVYPGNNDYSGLLKEVDLTAEAFGRGAEVSEWICEAKTIAAGQNEPCIATGDHCSKPNPCGFLSHCQAEETQAAEPIAWLPGRFKKELKAHINANSVTEMRDLPDDLLTDIQRRVKVATLSGQTYFDRDGAARELANYMPPGYFLDFETILFSVPLWKGTHPYQQIPFQFSAHHLLQDGTLCHHEFVDLSGDDPSEALANDLIDVCGTVGPIYAYNATFEKGRIEDLAQRFPSLATPLKAMAHRLVDLLPVANKYFYHPDQHGSWSIKAVLPALCPDLRYDKLIGVQNGGMAMEAFIEAISPETLPSRKQEIRAQLLAYCALDTYAMVRMWSAFTGITVPQ